MPSAGQQPVLTGLLVPLRWGFPQRCSSILFHLEVPGGMWHTVTASPVSSAKAASSAFHARVP